MMEKCVEPLQKKTMGVTFFSQNQLLTFSLSTKDTFLCTRPKSACGKSSSCRFSFSAARNAITQVKYVIFGFIFVFCFTFPSRKFWATLSVWNTNCLLAAKRQATLDWERPTLCHSFSNLKQLIDDIKLILKKSYCNIVRVLLRFLSGREIHLKHRSLYNNFFP